MESGMWKQIKDTGLLFVLALIVLGVPPLAGVVKGEEANWERIAVVMVVLGLVGIVSLRMYYASRERSEARALAQGRHELEQECAALREEIEGLRGSLASPVVDLITKQDYARILKEWSESGGTGRVQLYNIELQSFENLKVIEATWGGLKQLDAIEEVALLLPTAKVRRWESIVVEQSGLFFADEANQKFSVCEYEAAENVGEGPAPVAVGFATYQWTSGPRDGQHHPKAVWFILSRPFSQLRRKFVDRETQWWDYEHILAINGREDLQARAAAIWTQLYDPNQARDVPRVQSDAAPLEPIEPEVLFERLQLPPSVREERLRHFEPRVLRTSEPAVIPLDAEEGTFTLTYDNGDAVHGHFTGVDAKTRVARPAIVWVGGFTEKQYTELWRLFEKALRRQDAVQFYYEVSPPIADITLTRYAQDMREVIEFVSKQTHVVSDGRAVLIARSINGLVGALVGADPEIGKKLAGVILVAPVFDVIAMMDNYRRLRGQPTVTVEKCWRLSPGFDNGVNWEASRRIVEAGNGNAVTEGGWLEFFDHEVHLTIMADIIRHPRETYSLGAFTSAVGRISERCPVYILSHPDDPITGSQEALDRLNRAAGGAGIIRGDQCQYIQIDSQHLLPEDINKDAYPFSLRTEAKLAGKALREILSSLGLPPLPQESEVGAP